MQRHFYATSNNLLPVLNHIEAKLQLAYTLTGLFDKEVQDTHANGTILPKLEKWLNAENAIAGPAYLVTERSLPIQGRVIEQHDGSKKYAVDQLLNPDSVVFQHGGFYTGKILLSGRVATVSDTPAAMKIDDPIMPAA